MRTWIAGLMRDWHRKKALRLTALAEAHGKEMRRLMAEAEKHRHCASHWQLHYQQLGGK